MASRNGPQYELSCPSHIFRKLEAWGSAARDRGVLDRFLKLVQIIWRNLATKPLEWGDPDFRLHHLELDLFRAIAEYFLVQYGVDRARRIVYVKDVRLLDDHPLGDID